MNIEQILGQINFAVTSTLDQPIWEVGSLTDITGHEPFYAGKVVSRFTSDTSRQPGSLRDRLHVSAPAQFVNTLSTGEARAFFGRTINHHYRTKLETTFNKFQIWSLFFMVAGTGLSQTTFQDHKCVIAMVACAAAFSFLPEKFKSDDVVIKRRRIIEVAGSKDTISALIKEMEFLKEQLPDHKTQISREFNKEILRAEHAAQRTR